MFISMGGEMHCGSMSTPFAMPLGSAKPAECTKPLLPRSSAGPRLSPTVEVHSLALSQASQNFQAFPQKNVPTWQMLWACGML